MTPPRGFIDSFPEFRGPSWNAWRGVFDRLGPDVRELYAAVGRGGGKSRACAALACCFATREYPRAPGETIYVGIFAPDRKQAGITFRYVLGLLKSVPAFAALIVAERADAVELATGVVIEVITASTAAPRGRAYALAIIEEAAFLPSSDTAADPDVELLRALRPALARVPGSLLAVIGSPFARRGVLYDAVMAGDAPDRVVVTGDTLTFNSTFRRREVERAFETDPVAAAAEYGRDGRIEFRGDVAALLSAEVLAAAVEVGVRELPPPGVPCVAHLDEATGAGTDAKALAIACHDGEFSRLVAVRQWRPPFSPSVAASEAAALLRRYGAHQDVTIDAFAPGLVADIARREGIHVRPAQTTTSAAFLDLMAALNCGTVRLLDDPVLLRELSRLERRPTPSGREHVGHPARGHDDVAAAAAFALSRVARTEARGPLRLLFPVPAGQTAAGAETLKRIVELEEETEALEAQLGLVKVKVGER